MNEYNLKYRQVKKENFKLQILKKDRIEQDEIDDGDEIDEEEEMEEELDPILFSSTKFFKEFDFIISKLESFQIADEECERYLQFLEYYIYVLDSSIKQNFITSPEQFILLFHTIYVLHKINRDNNLLFCSICNITNTLIEKYPEFVDILLDSYELENYIENFNYILGAWDQTILYQILTKSANSAPILISNGLLDNIFNTLQSTIKENFENFDQLNNSFITQYWISMIISLKTIVSIYNTDKSVINSIFDCCTQFLSDDFLKIPGFVVAVIKCIAVCIQTFDDLSQFSIELYLPFLISLLKNKDKRFRESVMNLFDTISMHQFHNHWDPLAIIEITDKVLSWKNEKICNEIEARNNNKSLSIFFDFISHVIAYQPDIYDCLTECSFFGIPFFDIVFSMFENESHSLKIYIIRLFMSLTSPKIWPKSVFYILNNSILTSLFLSLDSDIDEQFHIDIINCLIQICSVNFSSSPYEIQSQIIEELQNDAVFDALENLESENSETNELISDLAYQINLLTMEKAND